MLTFYRVSLSVENILFLVKNENMCKFILIGCEDCQVSYATECPTHRMQMIFDKVVLSRAWASLPPQLQIFRLGESSGITIYFAKCSSYFFIRNAYL